MRNNHHERDLLHVLLSYHGGILLGQVVAVVHHSLVVLAAVLDDGVELVYDDLHLVVRVHDASDVEMEEIKLLEIMMLNDASSSKIT